MPDEDGPGFRVHKDRRHTETEPVNNRTMLIGLGMILGTIILICSIAAWVYVEAVR